METNNDRRERIYKHLKHLSDVAKLNCARQSRQYDPVEGDPEGKTLSERLGNPEGLPGPWSKREIEKIDNQLVKLLDSYGGYVH